MFIWSKFSLKITFSSSNLMIWLCDGRTYIHTGSGSLTSYRTWKYEQQKSISTPFSFWKNVTNELLSCKEILKREAKGLGQPLWHLQDWSINQLQNGNIKFLPVCVVYVRTQLFRLQNAKHRMENKIWKFCSEMFSFSLSSGTFHNISSLVDL